MLLLNIPVGVTLLFTATGGAAFAQDLLGDDDISLTPKVTEQSLHDRAFHGRWCSKNSREDGDLELCQLEAREQFP